MGLFSFIETFFFISLGITFVLILLLVYHFKQRITVIEKKSDTMFEIINNVVQELTNLRNQHLMVHRVPVSLPPAEFLASTFNVQSMENNAESEEEDSDDDDSEDGEDFDEDDDDSTKNDPLSDDDDDNNSENGLTPLEETQAEESDIKVINVENLDKIEVDELPELHESDNDTTENLETADVLETVDILDTADVLETVEHLEENIQVQKLEEEEPLETSDDNSTPSENSKEVYRKMNLGALKALVITKGLCTDPSKMKKHELLKMLESNE
jgi:hypothetical protein